MKTKNAVEQDLATRAEPSAVELQINGIVRSADLQFRALDRGTVNRYAAVLRSEGPLPPVKVACFNGAHVLVDGWHRVAALERIGEHKVRAVVEPVGSEEEIRWLAAEANTRHGRPLKSKEYREVFRAYVHARKHRGSDGSFKSYRVIAAEIGGAKGYTTVRNWMKKDFPSVFRAMSGFDEPPGSWQGDLRAPDAALAEETIAALEQARAALPAVTSSDSRDRIMDLLDDMRETVRRMG